MDKETTTKGTSHFAPKGVRKTTRKSTKHDFSKKIFDDALEKAEELGVSVSEYLSRITDATHNLN